MTFTNKNDEPREKMVLYLDKVVCKMKTSRQIEQGIYNYIIEVSKDKNIQRKWSNQYFKNLYNSKVLSVYSNLNENCYIKNNQLLNSIRTKEISPTRVGGLSVYDTFPNNWKELLNIKSKKDKIKYEIKPEAMTNLFKCRKCSSRETSYYEVQTRSADEPMTQFITCLKCNNRWRQ